MAHLSRHNTPKGWRIKRKETKWITKPLPGPHAIKRAISISLLLKNLLCYAKTTREVHYILHNKGVMINNVIRADEKFPIGIFDIIEIPKTKEYFRLLQDEHSRFVLHKVPKEEAGIKPSKIINKTKLKKGKTQINLFDGRNIIIEKDTYKVGDTLILDLKSNKIRSHLKLEKNAKIYLMEGKYTGHVAVVEDIIQTDNLNPSRLICGYKNKKFETLKKYAFVIGNEITTPEQNA